MFKNEPLTDFTIAAERALYEQALQNREKIIASGGIKAGSVVNGVEHQGILETQSILNPSKTSETVGTLFFADIPLAEQALSKAHAACPVWAKVPMKQRADVLRRAARIMHERKFDLSALITVEVGKPWKESDADVAEAIDFCTYYAAHADQLAAPQKTQDIPGEDNFYHYQPRGVAVVIAPWNFPLAIACGMTVAALVTGNPTILKPAEQSSLIAYEFAKILFEAGVPKEVFHLLIGKGETVGDCLVRSPLTSLICFTGSKTVGLEILKNAAIVHPTQHHIKKVILELGGKNAVIVDEDADLDEAIRGILYSSFGFAGQKCSACSRLIVVGSAYEPLLERLRDAVSDIILAEARDPSAYLGPVVDGDAYNRINTVINGAKAVLTVLAQGASQEGGYFIPPTIFRDVPEAHSLWQEEIFGPVVAAAKVQDFSEAIALANRSKYALTGAVYSRNPKHILEAKENLEVGNLYINRGCTGAMVQRQPFGGFKLSGVGSKAGGVDYLIQFVEPRTISENTMRRGFTG